METEGLHLDHSSAQAPFGLDAYNRNLTWDAIERPPKARNNLDQPMEELQYQTETLTSSGSDGGSTHQ
ncbi:unnamed protein product [Linum trigynum]|uniref:Uncharacterized protein n=1 Tax=Linum trigynum TaxID=586398 RepID=A0AAV2DT08_9ROSI